MSACAAQRNRRNIAFLMWGSLTTMTTTMTTTRRRKRSLHPMTTRRPPVRQTRTRQQGAARAAASTLGKAPPTARPRAPATALVRSPPRGGCGPADERPRRAAEGRCSPGEAGRRLQEASPPAVRAVRPAEASRPVWSSPRLFTASPPGQSCPPPVDMFHPPLREDHLPSDLFLLFVLFHPAATGHPKFGRLPRRSGCSTEPLDTSPGRAPVQRLVMSDR